MSASNETPLLPAPAPAHAAGPEREPVLTMSPRIRDFLVDYAPQSPCLVVDQAVVREQYRRLQEELPKAWIYYAVKANPDVVPLLASLGCSFDVASPGEVDICIDTGVDPSAISYGNPVKKREDIRNAYEKGIRTFSFDCLPELLMLGIAAPGSAVVCRIGTSGEGADWPLSRKFGCDPAKAVELLRTAQRIGLRPAGICFHVGSQQRDPTQWDQNLEILGNMAEEIESLCPEAMILNVGGGFPANYIQNAPPLADYAHGILQSIEKHFRQPPVLVIEPGRHLVADAGVIRTEIVQIRPPTKGEARRWIYLDIGRFGGLAESEGEMIRYPILTSYDGTPTGPVILAGPTCDSTDILYERTTYWLPLALQAGDFVDILGTGAYTASYASVGFNGFPPPRTYLV